MNAKPRRRLFVDLPVQGVLCLRAVIYWVMCVVSMWGMLLCWRMLTLPATMSPDALNAACSQFGPALICSALMVPIIVVDTLRVSNRFAGPMYRLRGALRDAADGKPVKMIKFRGDDFWRDVADDFNRLQARIEQLEQQVASAEESHELTAASS